MNEKDAILLIEEMISKTKNDIKENGFYYYFWGWLVFISAVSNFLILYFNWFEFHSLPWVILMPLGGIATAFFSFREKKEEALVKTYVSESMKYALKAYAVSLFIVCFTMSYGEQWKAFYPTIMMIYAIWLYVSGGLLNFKPLIWGAYSNWLLAAIGYMWPNTELHLVLIATGVLAGFIIPGHWLKYRESKRV